MNASSVPLVSTTESMHRRKLKPFGKMKLSREQKETKRVKIGWNRKRHKAQPDGAEEEKSRHYSVAARGVLDQT